tara:strand:- start:878 stop:2821 length:1944 start_codon:yes stop_codon:yes gene_type:complete
MKINYRPEINGLRAIAVGAVILYHSQINIFGINLFVGGFIGVDIFFVISGYLITSIILNELNTTGSFSLKNFYERRIRRLLPALLFVMFLSIPFAWKYLLPSDFILFSKSIIYSLGLSSNFYFHYSGQEYGAGASLIKPFLHTWSLSVEMQYYILYPILLLAIIRYYRRYLIYLLIILFVINLGLAEWSSKNYPSASFYFLHTRIWEFLAGSILGYFEISLEHRNKKKKISLILPSIGLILIGHSIIYFNDKMVHPSIYTLSPIIGACLIIWFSNKDEIITRVLSSKLFVGIGLISYSLYLWHYPIFAFIRVTDFTDGSILLKILLSIVILILSIFSYYLIEKPSNNKKNNFKIIFSLIIISIFILVFININIVIKKGYQKRFFFNNNFKLSRVGYFDEYNDFLFKYNYDNYDERDNVLIVGNSHADDILKILSKTSLKDKIYFNTPAIKIKEKFSQYQIHYFYNFLKERKTETNDYDSDFYNHLKKQYDKSEIIILASQYKKKDLEILNKLIKILKEENKKIIIFDNALELITKIGLNKLDYYVFKNKKIPNKINLNNIEEEVFLDSKNADIINSQIKKISEKNNIFLIESKKIFCNIIEKKCPLITEENYKIYWDSSHITNEGAVFFARKFEKYKLFLDYLNFRY